MINHLLERAAIPYNAPSTEEAMDSTGKLNPSTMSIKRPRSSETDRIAKLQLLQLSTLPAELMLQIFKFYLTPPEGRSLALISVVCKQWHASLNTLRIDLINQNIPLENIFRVLTDNLGGVDGIAFPLVVADFFKDFGTQLRCLNLSNCFDEIEFQVIGQLTQLQRLRIEERDITGAGFTALDQLKQLKELSLPFCRFDAEFEGLGQLTQLNKLDLSDCDIGDEQFKVIAQLTQLRSLSLEGNQIADTGAIAQLMQLQDLDFSCCDDITDECLKAIAQLPLLQSLKLHDCTEITDKGIEELAQLTLLETLVLAWTGMTDIGFKAIAHLTRLQNLDVYGCKITEAGLEAIAHLTPLQNLKR